jgi:hypothetical protein
MDPAALGTALIGLETIRRRDEIESSPTRHASRRRGQSTSRTVRVAFARTLRVLANAIDAHPLERAPEPGR